MTENMRPKNIIPNTAPCVCIEIGREGGREGRRGGGREVEGEGEGEGVGSERIAD